MICLVRGLTLKAFLVGLALIAADRGVAQEAGEPPMLTLVVDSSDSQSRMIAIGLSSLANSRVDAFDIDIEWSGNQENPLETIRLDGSDLGLVNLANVDPLDLDVAGNLRAVMKTWHLADPENGTADDDGPGYLLLAKSTTDETIVRHLVEAVQSDSFILKAARLDERKLAPSVAMSDLPLPLHAGAEDYLTGIAAGADAGSEPEPLAALSDADPAEDDIVTSRLSEDPVQNRTEPPAQTPIPVTAPNARSYILYFDTNDAALDQGRFESIARACNYAAKHPRAKFVISGHADRAGSASYNENLARQRADAVAGAIRNDARFREALSVIEFGESNPALATEDGVAEPMNRRVVITVVPDD